MVRKTIQYGATIRKRGHDPVGFDLIEVKPRLVSCKGIHKEANPRRLNLNGPRVFAEQNSRCQIHSLRDSHRRIVAFDHTGGPRRRSEQRSNQTFVLIHGEGERLKHQHASIAISNHARQPIAFAPYQAAQIAPASGTLPVFEGLGDAAAEKILIQFLAMTRDPTNHDLRAGIINPHAQKVIPPVLNGNKVSINGRPECF